MKELDFERISQKLKEHRIAQGITQEYVANIADVNTSHISNIENNRVKVSLSTLVNMCNALNTTVDSILEDEYTDTSSILDLEIMNSLHDCSITTKKQILKIIQILK